MRVHISVCPSFRGQLVKKLITLQPHGIVDQILHTNACQHYQTTGMRNFPIGILGQAWCLTISIPDHCPFPTLIDR